ncbi:MAG TPA: hypothetical protein VEG44_09645 [Candidatus Acidoferrales bacterium]|nr:hypothetical protein [Candidatus Acidoferrales bacterium]
MKRNKKEEELSYQGLRRDFAQYARQSDVWFCNAGSFKRTSELLLKQQEVDDQEFGERRERLEKHVKAGGPVNDPLGIHPPILRGTIAFSIAMAIELQLKATLIAASPIELVTEYGLDDEITHHNIQKLVQMVNSCRRDAIPLEGKAKLVDYKLFEKLKLIIECGKYGFPKDPCEYRNSSN